MTSVSVVPASGLIRDTSGSTIGVDRLPDEMNDMKIRDDKVMEASFCSCSNLLIILVSLIFSSLLH